MTKIKEVLQAMDAICSESIQESWDNSGLQWGDDSETVKGVIVSLDVTMDVINEAIDCGCNLIIAHHPLIFGPLKQVRKNGTEVERLAYHCIQNSIAVYAAHTNWDKVAQGVSWVMAKRIGLLNEEILQPEKDGLCNLKVMGTPRDIAEIRKAWFNAGIGNVGEYSNCSFTTDGWGTFEPSESANPSVGEKNKTEFLRENAIEILCTKKDVSKALAIATETSSYETIAHSIIPLKNTNDTLGFGCIGELKEALSLSDFLALCKEKYACKVVRYNPSEKIKNIKTVAVCGGSAIDFLPTAIARKADAYITADVKYHQFMLADDALTLVDVGHYESEIWAMEYLTHLISEKFHNFAIRLTTINTNSVRYF